MEFTVFLPTRYPDRRHIPREVFHSLCSEAFFEFGSYDVNLTTDGRDVVCGDYRDSCVALTIYTLVDRKVDVVEFARRSGERLEAEMIVVKYNPGGRVQLLPT